MFGSFLFIPFNISPKDFVLIFWTRTVLILIILKKKVFFGNIYALQRQINFRAGEWIPFVCKLFFMEVNGK